MLKQKSRFTVISLKSLLEAMNQSIMVISLIIQMQEVFDKLNANSDQDPSIDDIRKFLDAFIKH